MNLYKITLLAHIVSAVIWVGGMFFAHVILRPSLMDVDTAVRLSIWKKVFKKFFYWVWISVFTILITGYGIVFLIYGGLSGIQGRMHIYIMLAAGTVMSFIYFYIYFVPFQKFLAALSSHNNQIAAYQQGIMRKLVFFNLLLGIFIFISVYILR